jgi:hypothetical protein
MADEAVILMGWLIDEMVLAVADMTFGSRHTVLGVATRAMVCRMVVVGFQISR